MTDFGHELWFGAFLTPAAADHERLVRLAVHADRLGLDLLGIQDHPYQPAFLDTWTLLTTLAARTERIRLVPDVINLPLRQPAVLARSAASLDTLSGGRVELGLGAGAFWEGVAGMGGPTRTPAEAVEALEEAITILRALWRPGDAVRFEGRHYRLDGARPGPFPPHPIGIWIGSYKRRMLELTGRLGDGWLPSLAYAPPAEAAKMAEIIDAAAADAGRDPAQIRRVYNVNGRFERRAGGYLDGPPALWAEQLTELALEQGMSGFVLAPGQDAERDLRVFAEEVAPEVRRAVAGHRGTPAPESPRPARHELHDSTRPHAPKRDLAALTPAQRAKGQRLVQVHNHLRQEMKQIVDAVDQVAAGRTQVAALRDMINQLTMRQNYWSLGAFCASYCRLLTVHHTIEDAELFPRIRERQESLGPVVDRLAEEHEVIADVLTRLDAALAATIEDAAKFDGVREQVAILHDRLFSHLDYEEEELVEPLSRLDVEI
ncbi:hypothetical protein Misp01_41320 [Microtetraspora sp. NBRC 13810]|uniref:LLM class flavin-dependent oxidoreductase n=1 Tax=Microtetraspora sp. NBRC 13810 TaxID=3030990 RepID=UPI002554E8F3|nr:LLM class flavin-dependent oxidoreductase [Microtetraspora sp. NBRC 13810]GLW09002.1 hypothetical protein Misp01_41320 [Microtetraspora sp. NBRC 13810]